VSSVINYTYSLKAVDKAATLVPQLRLHLFWSQPFKPGASVASLSVSMFAYDPSNYFDIGLEPSWPTLHVLNMLVPTTQTSP